ncbi:MAG: sigma-70 family RNA polymerase sigma factor [Verrucomicrobiae bacterium]|nr:sigma-70 family RNA polymerase sigma factor [Verrucomicrobiae bacterium]NNJ44205.1 sigma-70 family RNA polymerase sigma factor [Akkermansiaceae bacterium]
MSDKKENSEKLNTYVALLVEHQDRLRAYIYTQLPGSSNVSDVLQNTNAVLWQKREKFKPGTNFLAWAFQIARFQIKQQHGRNKRDGKLVFSDELLEHIAESSPTDSPQNRLLEALEGCMAKLTGSQRKIILARYTRGQSLEQLAQTRGCTAGSLRISLHRLRESLRKCVENSLSDPSR